MRFAPLRSQFVWVTNESNRLRFRHLIIPESVALRVAVTRFIADDVESGKQRRARTARIANGLAAQFLRQNRMAPFSGPVEAARAAYDGAQSALSNAERNRRDWRDWANRSANAFDLVANYNAILTLTELRAQARALAVPALADQIRRAHTASELQQVLGDHRDDRRQRLAQIDIPQMCRAELQAYRSFVGSMTWPNELARVIDLLLPQRGDGDCPTT